MIYLMPIDECHDCGARTPTIFKHRCSTEQNGGVQTTAAAEIQSWIATLVAARATRPDPATRRPADLHDAIQAEPTLTDAAKSHLIGLVNELSRAA